MCFNLIQVLVVTSELVRQLQITDMVIKLIKQYYDTLLSMLQSELASRRCIVSTQGMTLINQAFCFSLTVLMNTQLISFSNYRFRELPIDTYPIFIRFISSRYFIVSSLQFSIVFKSFFFSCLHVLLYKKTSAHHYCVLLSYPIVTEVGFLSFVSIFVQRVSFIVQAYCVEYCIPV